MSCGSAFAAELRSLTPERRQVKLKGFKAGMNYEFRLFDDDGELYYEGLCKDLDDMDGDSAFGPLDWATNDAGCTVMKYRKRGMTQWKVL